MVGVYSMVEKRCTLAFQSRTVEQPLKNGGFVRYQPVIENAENGGLEAVRTAENPVLCSRRPFLYQTACLPFEDDVDLQIFNQAL